VELFRSYGVAVAPTQRSSVRPPPHEADCAAAIGFSAPRFSGTLTLSVPLEVLKSMRDAPQGDAALNDWIREITNQLLGRIKNRLMRFQVVLQVGLPAAVKGGGALKGSGAELVYVFHTLRDQVLVVIEGSLDPSVLQFSGNMNIASEGDVILFERSDQGGNLP